MDMTSLFYQLVLNFIKICKWGELQLIKLFIGPITRICKELAEVYCGLVFHFPENGNDVDEKTKISEEKRVLAKCKNYSTAVHLKIYNKNEFFARIVTYFNMGYGETYMDGIWEYFNSQEDLVEVSSRLYEQGANFLYYNPWNKFLSWLEFEAFDLQTVKKVSEIAEHYNLGNDMYETMLDPYMQYSCGYWARADNLNDAQLDKLELIAQKLKLKPGMKILDLGCGWGMLCKYLAEKYDVSCVGVTISQEQGEYGQERCKGLDVEIRVQDYREVDGQFDRVVSVGMMEHVGKHNYPDFFKAVHKNLKDDGIFLLHCIGMNNKYIASTDHWVIKYIFQNAMLPRLTQVVNYSDGMFVIEDLHNFGLDYAKTLVAWRKNFNKSWPTFENKYGKRFYRMWIIYLCLCEAIFKTRSVQLWQFVMSKGGLKTDYRAPR